MFRKFYWRSALICSIVALLLVSPSYSAIIRNVDVVTAEDGSAYINVIGNPAFRITKSIGKLSAESRAKIIASRLSNALRKDVTASSVNYVTKGRDTEITVGPDMIYRITSSEAKMSNSTSESMASSWVKKLRSILSIPPLAVDPSSVTIPLGESRSLKVSSIQSLPIATEVADTSIVDCDDKSVLGSIVLKGKAVGSTLLNVKSGDVTVPVFVSVKKYSAYSSSTYRPKAIVTGWKLSEAFLDRVLKDTAVRNIRLENGSNVVKVTPMQNLKDLPVGQSVDVPVQINTSGDGYLPAKIDLRIAVENRSLPPTETSELMYSNDPERVDKYQVLYTGRLPSSESSSRLLYHHQNMTGKRIGLVIEVLNAGKSSASLHIIEGVSPPMVDTVLVGYRAGRDFMENYTNRNGRIVDIQAGTRRAILSESLDAGETASGIFDLRSLEGEPPIVRVVAKPEELRVVEDSLDQDYPIGNSVNDLPISDGVFPKPFAEMKAEYTLGQAWTFIRLGKIPLKHASQNLSLFGNYGVLHDIEISLKNDHKHSHSAELVFEATAGPASGVFYVDGKLCTVRYLASPYEATISKVLIPAMGSRTVHLVTMPLSGSAYPATVIVRPGEPLDRNED